MSSARLASSEKWLNARMTWLADADVERGQPVGQLGAVDLGAADLEGLDAGRLDQVEDVGAGLLADHLAEDPAEQPDVVAQRRVVGAVVGARRARRGAEVGDVDGGFGHAAQYPAAV